MNVKEEGVVDIPTAHFAEMRFIPTVNIFINKYHIKTYRKQYIPDVIRF
jgi:hypothetical protein